MSTKWNRDNCFIYQSTNPFTGYVKYHCTARNHSNWKQNIINNNNTINRNFSRNQTTKAMARMMNGDRIVLVLQTYIESHRIQLVWLLHQHRTINWKSIKLLLRKLNSFRIALAPMENYLRKCIKTKQHKNHLSVRQAIFMKSNLCIGWSCANVTVRRIYRTLIWMAFSPSPRTTPQYLPLSFSLFQCIALPNNKISTLLLCRNAFYNKDWQLFCVNMQFAMQEISLHSLRNKL